MSIYPDKICEFNSSYQAFNPRIQNYYICFLSTAVSEASDNNELRWTCCSGVQLCSCCRKWTGMLNLFSIPKDVILTFNFGLYTESLEVRLQTLLSERVPESELGNVILYQVVDWAVFYGLTHLHSAQLTCMRMGKIIVISVCEIG